MSQLFHPLVVHFPIALWLTSGLFDLLYVLRAEEFHYRAARLLIGLGLLGALVAIATGFADLGRFSAEELGQAFLDRHRVHQLFSFASTFAYAASFALRTRRVVLGRRALVGVMVAGAALIAWTGWLGGELRMVM
jgi:uncharacterized membrane protein